MSFTYRCGPTAAIANRTSWGPVSTPTSIDPKSFDRPMSGNFDRIFNSFERTNTFEIVKDTPEKEERQMVQADVVVNRKMSSSFERADCSLAAQSPCIEDEDYYREKILYSQARQLFPLQEDLADWINKTIGITYLSGENFFDVLDNGVELCQLAAVIHERAVAAADQGIITGPVPSIRGRCWQRAARRSFFSRDNTENFITFCRDLGVHDNLLFESDDLVLHNQPRQVILCLLEVARLATRYNVEPPGLVALEKEIALEERDSGLDSAMSSAGWQFRDASPVPGDKSKAEPSPSPDGKQATSLPVEVSSGAAGGGGGEGAGAEDARSVGSAAESLDSCDSDEPLRPTNELDKRVQLVTRLLERGCRCGAGAGRCDRLLKVKKVGEGRYNIAGRNVFIRLLKGRHMMVRVGGGWDTLEHFLSRHEPCQVRLVTPARRAAPHAAPVPHPAPAAHPAPAPAPSTDTPDGRTADRVHSSTHTKETSVSPTPSSASSISGKISPVDKKSRKISPVPSTKQKSPVPEAGRATTPNKPKPARNMTLPLKTEIPKRKQSAPSLSNPNTPIGKPKTPLTEQRKSLTSNSLLLKSRSMNLAQDKKPFCGTERLNKAKSLATTPTETPKKMRSQSLASTPVSENRKSFCGTDKLNTYAKKTRSMSLASPMAFKPINKSISVTVPGPMTQAAIEESIRQSLAASIEDNSSNKPFLHIKAKYRSPPPREVPPR